MMAEACERAGMPAGYGAERQGRHKDGRGDVRKTAVRTKKAPDKKSGALRQRMTCVRSRVALPVALRRCGTCYIASAVWAM